MKPSGLLGHSETLARSGERMPPPVRGIDLKDKVKIVRTLDWFARGAQRHRALRENPRAKEPERASCFFEYLVYGAIPLDGQLVSRWPELESVTNLQQQSVQLLPAALEPNRLLSGCHMPAPLL